MARIPDSEADGTSTGVFKRKLAHVALQFLVANFGKVVSFAGGVLAAYLAIWSQIGAASSAAADAKATAVDLKRDVAELRAELQSLVTERELEGERERIRNLEERLNYATDQAGTPPVSPNHRKQRKP